LIYSRRLSAVAGVGIVSARMGSPAGPIRVDPFVWFLYSSPLIAFIRSSSSCSASAFVHRGGVTLPLDSFRWWAPRGGLAWVDRMDTRGAGPSGRAARWIWKVILPAVVH